MNRNVVNQLGRALAGSASRRQTLQLLSGGLASGFALTIGRKGATAQSNPFVGIPITGPVTLPDGATGAFTGTLDIARFIVRAGQLVAVGRLTGTVTNEADEVVRQITDAVVRLPVAIGDARCDILHLELGPLDLDLLGLVIHLNRIDLEIDAQSGPGNLLGNLLCAITGLLDRGVRLSVIAGLLNRLIRVLGRRLPVPR